MMNNKGLDFDYVGKMDSDTLIHMVKYFNFADNNLHPFPFNEKTMEESFLTRPGGNHRMDVASEEETVKKDSSKKCILVLNKTE